MGTLNLEAFRAELLFDLRNRTDTTTAEGLSTARQDMYINAGYLWVTHPSVYRHRELQVRYQLTLVAGDFDYTFTPTPGLNAFAITSLRSVSHCINALDRLTDQRTKLLPQDMQWFEGRTHTTGAPRNYGVIGDQIVVSPVPTAAEAGQILSVMAIREPAALTAGNTTVLSTLWDEIVLLAARWRAELHLGYRDLAEATKLDVVGLINEYRDFEFLHGEDWDWATEVRVERTMEAV